MKISPPGFDCLGPGNTLSCQPTNRIDAAAWEHDSLYERAIEKHSSALINRADLKYALVFLYRGVISVLAGAVLLFKLISEVLIFNTVLYPQELFSRKKMLHSLVLCIILIILYVMQLQMECIREPRTCVHHCLANYVHLIDILKCIVNESKK